MTYSYGHVRVHKILVPAPMEVPMKKTIEEGKEYAKVIAKAWVDEEFKKRLLGDPELS